MKSLGRWVFLLVDRVFVHCSLLECLLSWYELWKNMFEYFRWHTGGSSALQVQPIEHSLSFLKVLVVPDLSPPSFISPLAFLPFSFVASVSFFGATSPKVKLCCSIKKPIVLQ